MNTAKKLMLSVVAVIAASFIIFGFVSRCEKRQEQNRLFEDTVSEYDSIDRVLDFRADSVERHYDKLIYDRTSR